MEVELSKKPDKEQSKEEANLDQTVLGKKERRGWFF